MKISKALLFKAWIVAPGEMNLSNWNNYYKIYLEDILLFANSIIPLNKYPPNGKPIIYFYYKRIKVERLLKCFNILSGYKLIGFLLLFFTASAKEALNTLTSSYLFYYIIFLRVFNWTPRILHEVCDLTVHNEIFPNTKLWGLIIAPILLITL